MFQNNKEIIFHPPAHQVYNDMNVSTVHDILLDNRKVASITNLGETTHMGASYEWFFTCDLLFENISVPIYIGIPVGWAQELVDIYVVNHSSFAFIPHVDTNGKLCLFDLEGSLIDADFEGIINQCIDRAIDIITKGLNGSNKEDFINEFSLYWCQLPNTLKLKCIIPSDNSTQRIKFVEKGTERSKVKNNSSYGKQKDKITLFAATDLSHFESWGEKGTYKNGLYVFIQTNNYIYPPDGRKSLEIDYVNNLLKLAASKQYSSAVAKTGNDKMVVFQIKQPNGTSNFFGVYLKNADFIETEGIYQVALTATLKVFPLDVHRIDKPYLISRTSEIYSTATRKCLLIGCGSIGGYLTNELVKADFEDITLVDKDIITEENIYRHFLGIEYIGCYKTYALASHFKKNIPYSNIKSFECSIQDSFQDGSIDFNEYDLVISATGNPNVNRWLNTIVLNNCIQTPFIYVWNEPLDIGCHAAVIQSSRKGCYECFFKRRGLMNELYDSTAYCAPGQKIARSLTGCGGSFIPYSSTVSLKSTALCMDLINRVLENKTCENMLVSMKGDGYYFEKANLTVSDIYINQNNDKAIISGTTFQSDDCALCGFKYGI